MRFKYQQPTKLSDALCILAGTDPPPTILAGGTDLLVNIQEKIETPVLLVDISRIEELTGIEEKEGTIRIGSLETASRIARSPLLKARGVPLPSSAVEVGSPQIRSRATLGGNIATASPSGDMIPALVALEAILTLKSSSEEREVPIEDFFTGVKKSVLRPDELLTGVTFPARGKNHRGFFLKLGQRRALAIAKVSVAASLDLNGGTVQKARIALGAVAPTVIRAPRTEAFLEGKPLDPDLIRQASRTCSQESKAITDIRSTSGYRDEMAGVLLGRGLETIRK